MCQFCGDNVSHLPASSSSKDFNNITNNITDGDISDEGFIDEIERQLVGEEEGDFAPDYTLVEDSDDEDIPLSAKMLEARRARGKRSREDDSEDGSVKRYKPEALAINTWGDAIEGTPRDFIIVEVSHEQI